jgi:P-type Ca2+ transporter type 2C
MDNLTPHKPCTSSATPFDMYKMIFGQAIFQLGVTLFLHFAGASRLGYDRSNEYQLESLNTLIFNTFVWLQIFNELNNRHLDNRLNIFEGITKNWFFLAINCIMIGGQVLIIFVGSDAFKIHPLNGKEWCNGTKRQRNTTTLQVKVERCPVELLDRNVS